jgi:ubiquinone/menaquinone biosynthesis C-methylase UbiE
MKLNLAERLLVNNPARSFVQKYYEVPMLIAAGGPVNGKRALEIGCGRGIGVELILEKLGASSVCAVDLDPKMVELAAQHTSRFGSRVELKVGDAAALPYPDAAFDAVFDFGIIHHISDWRRAVAEVQRVLKPAGTFYFEEVSRKALEKWIYRALFDHPTQDRFSREEFVDEMRRIGMTVARAPEEILFGDIFIGAASKAS